MNRTAIEWCTHSVNPLRARDPKTNARGHFCIKISPGCAHCYSARLQSRFRMHDFVAKNRRLVDSYLDVTVLRKTIRHKQPASIFWCDMTDLFGEWVPDEWIDQVLAAIALMPQSTHMILTKRAERMLSYFLQPETPNRIGHQRALLAGASEMDLAEDGPAIPVALPLKNLRLGVSVENQQYADERIPLLLQTPAAVRFLSVEPLLGPVSLWHFDEEEQAWRGAGVIRSGGMTVGTPSEPPEGYDDSQPGIDWVIVGGESGPGARPMHPEWARLIRDQCQGAGIPFFFKQWGEWLPLSHQHHADPTEEQAHMLPDGRITEDVNFACVQVSRVGKKCAGRVLDGREWNEYPEVYRGASQPD